MIQELIPLQICNINMKSERNQNEGDLIHLQESKLKPSKMLQKCSLKEI